MILVVDDVEIIYVGPIGASTTSSDSIRKSIDFKFFVKTRLIKEQQLL